MGGAGSRGFVPGSLAGAGTGVDGEGTCGVGTGEGMSGTFGGVRGKYYYFYVKIVSLVLVK